MQVKIHTSIEEIPADVWNRLFASSCPFVRHEFLSLLESSGCASATTGWQPVHLSLGAGDGDISAVMPVYLKNHSRGEYVFDYSWADAYMRRGMAYYPKLVTAVPFSPVGGPRMGVGNMELAECSRYFQKVLLELLEDFGASSWHMLFVDDQQYEQLDEGFKAATRYDVQYHWFNYGYSGYDDFLGRCTSRRRKNLRKEREQVRAQGISFRQFTGETLGDVDWECFYSFYEATYFKRGMVPYLDRGFFLSLVEKMPRNLLLVQAEKNGRPVAMALSFQDDKTLYGRYWGCHEEYKLLHFETCYYQGIEYCIRKGLTKFDPGTQGEHKIARGFEPVITRSVHLFGHHGFADAIEDFCRQEREHIESYLSHAKLQLPFRKELLE